MRNIPGLTGASVAETGCDHVCRRQIRSPLERGAAATDPTTPDRPKRNLDYPLWLTIGTVDVQTSTVVHGMCSAGFTDILCGAGRRGAVRLGDVWFRLLRQCGAPPGDGQFGHVRRHRAPRSRASISASPKIAITENRDPRLRDEAVLRGILGRIIFPKYKYMKV